MADPGKGPGRGGPPPFLDQTEKKNFWRPPPPPFSKGLDDRLPLPQSPHYLSQGLDPAL